MSKRVNRHRKGVARSIDTHKNKTIPGTLQEKLYCSDVDRMVPITNWEKETRISYIKVIVLAVVELEAEELRRKGASQRAAGGSHISEECGTQQCNSSFIKIPTGWFK